MNSNLIITNDIKFKDSLYLYIKKLNELNCNFLETNTKIERIKKVLNRF